jgi:hypothetical protein
MSFFDDLKNENHWVEVLEGTSTEVSAVKLFTVVIVRSSKLVGLSFMSLPP